MGVNMKLEDALILAKLIQKHIQENPHITIEITSQGVEVKEVTND